MKHNTVDTKAQMVRSNSSPREIALDVILAVLEDKAFSHIALREALEAHEELPVRDRGLVTRLTEGTIEHMIQLDAILNDYASIKVSKMKPLIRNLLRMTAYQILYMDRIPDAAAINEAVKIAKKHKFQGLSGFVNGVSRSIARNRDQILAGLNDPDKTPLFVRYCLPEWLFQYLDHMYGRTEACRIAEYYISGDNVNYVRFRDGHTEEMKGNISDSEAFKQGEITVQDYASQQVGMIADPKPGDLVVDVCAAPGGKSCHAAALLNGTGMVDARDLSSEKVRMIDENIRRLGLSNIRTKVWDARIPDESLIQTDGSGKADIVLCDLPCSGLGIIGKKPDIRYSVSLEDIKSLQQLQREILKTAVCYVKPGGKLLYSTCTLTREENEDNAAWIETELGLQKVKEIKFLPGNPSDGFFISEFIKK
ncbi:MAG: transcription antitermination factor NusB [Oribacterium sp.]|nr:transcription antitermination factor NusB [Oribacterium sp.]